MSSHFSDHQKDSGSFGCNGKSVMATKSFVPCEQIADQNNETFNPSPSPTNVHGFIGVVAGDNRKQLPTGAARTRALTLLSREASSMALQLQLIFLFQMACTLLAILTRGMMYIMITAVLFSGELDLMAVECTQSLVHDSDL
ncbi:unnamed protein product [Musa textilis]